MPFFDHPPTYSNVLTEILLMTHYTRLCNSNAFADHPPTPSTLRNLWTTSKEILAKALIEFTKKNLTMIMLLNKNNLLLFQCGSVLFVFIIICSWMNWGVALSNFWPWLLHYLSQDYLSKNEFFIGRNFIVIWSNFKYWHS